MKTERSRPLSGRKAAFSLRPFFCADAYNRLVSATLEEILGSRLTGRLSEERLLQAIGVVLVVAATSMVVQALA